MLISVMIIRCSFRAIRHNYEHYDMMGIYVDKCLDNQVFFGVKRHNYEHHDMMGIYFAK